MIDVMAKTKDRKKGPVLSEKRARLMRLICTGTEEELAHFLFEELSDEEFDPVVLPMIRMGAEFIRDMSGGDLSDAAKKNLAAVERIVNVH
jgi:hypothetical protein